MTGRTVSDAPGYAPEEDDFDPSFDDFVSKERSYTHFDLRLSEDARSAVRATPDAILQNSFWPLLGFEKAERRVKRDASGATSFEVKTRDIKFGSHQDAALFEHYASQLAVSYEKMLTKAPFGNSVLAYRRSVGNNISQAKTLFDEIRKSKAVTAIALDISGFFDNISHKFLMQNLRDVLGVEILPDHDFLMYKRMTNFEWVDAEALEIRLRGVLRPKGRICDAYQFRKHVRVKGNNLIKRNSNEFGIPQGTPLSGLYANISLFDFDRNLHQLVSSVRGSARRYSDDIAILIPSDIDSDTIIENVRGLLKDIGLSLSDKKTDVCRFSEIGGVLLSDKPFQYLGFTFDGQKTLIRQSSLNRYYSKMRSGVYSKISAAHRQSIPRESIYMRELYKKYTHFGKHRNFPRYAYRASEILNAPEIRKQISNHFNILKEMVTTSVNYLY